MSTRDPGLATPDAGQLLAQLSTEMVQAQKRWFGKGPTQAKSYFLDDMLLIVMQGGLTTAERTMLDFGEEDLVRQFRQTFENRMTERLTGMVEEVTGRKVLTYQSQILFDPDRVVELFVFDDRAPDALIAATAEAQLSGESPGLVAGDDAPDTPAPLAA